MSENRKKTKTHHRKEVCSVFIFLEQRVRTLLYPQLTLSRNDLKTGFGSAGSSYVWTSMRSHYMKGESPSDAERERGRLTPGLI